MTPSIVHVADVHVDKPLPASLRVLRIVAMAPVRPDPRLVLYLGWLHAFSGPRREEPRTVTIAYALDSSPPMRKPIPPLRASGASGSWRRTHRTDDSGITQTSGPS